MKRVKVLEALHEVLAEANPYHGKTGHFQGKKKPGIYSYDGEKKAVIGGRGRGRRKDCGRENREVRCWDNKEKPWQDWPSKAKG